MKFASQYRTRLTADHALILNRLENLLYTQGGSKQDMVDLVTRSGFELSSESQDENCLLDAVVDQLNRLHKVTDSDELRQEAVAYLERCPSLEDDTPLQTFVQDEEWHRCSSAVRASVSDWRTFPDMCLIYG